jgi:hypothetical protein
LVRLHRDLLLSTLPTTLYSRMVEQSTNYEECARVYGEINEAAVAPLELGEGSKPARVKRNEEYG